MSDIGDIFDALKNHKKALRAKYGIDCPQCKVKRPNACASILIPQKRCRVDGYVDQRPELTTDQWKAA